MVKTEEEAKDCIADELQPDRNVIDEDLMQDVDKNEGDDLVMKNGPQSIKVLVMDHTNDKTLDDERVQTWSKEPSRVVDPIVKRKNDCEESDWG